VTVRRILLITFSILAAIFLVAIGLLYYLLYDQDWIKGQAQDFTTELTGRQLTIDGPLVIDLAMHPTVEVQDVRLANAPWAGSGDFVSLHRLQLSFDLMSLFTDQFDLDFIEVEGLLITLQENDEGEVNWDLFADEEDSVQDDEPMKALPFRLGHLSLKNFAMTHDAPDRTEPLDFLISKLELDRMKGGVAEASASGSLGGLPLEFSGQLGPMKHLIIGGSMDIKMDLVLGEIDFNILGHVADSLTGKGAEFTINLSGPEFSWLTKKLAFPDFSTGPYDFDLVVDTEGRSTRIDLVGNLGSLVANASGKIDDLEHPRNGEVDFEMTGPDLQLLAEAFGEPNLPAEPYHFKGDVSLHLGAAQIHSLLIEIGDNTGQVAGTVGEWPELRGTKLDVHFEGPDLSQWSPVLHVENISPRPFNYTGTVENTESSLILTTNRLEAGDSYIELAGSLGRPPDFLGAALDVDLMTPDLSAITILPGHSDLPAMPLTLNGSIGRSQENILLKDMKVALSDNRVVINGQLALGDDFFGSNLSTRADIPSLAALGKVFGVQALPDFPLAMNADWHWSAKGLEFEISDSSFGELNFDLDGNLPDLAEITSGAVQFSVSIPSFLKIPYQLESQGLPDVPFTASGRAEYSGEMLVLSDISGKAGDSQFDFDATLNTGGSLVGSRVKFTVAGPDFKPLVPVNALLPLPGKFRLSGSIEKGVDADALRNLKLELGNLRASLDGTVDDLADISFAELSIAVSGPAMSELDGFMDRDYPDMPFALNSTIAGSDYRFRINPLQATLGPSDLTGNLELDLGDRIDIQGRLESKFLDIAWLKAPSDDDEPEADSGSTSEGDSGRVFPDTPIPWENDLGVDLGLDLAVDILVLDAGVLNEIKLALALTDDSLRLNSFEFGGPLGEKVSGSFLIGNAAGETVLDFVMDGNDFRLGLAAGKDQDVNTYPQTDVSIDVKGTGVTWHDLASSLNGRLRIVQDKGLIANAGLDLIFSDLLSELFATLNPFAQRSEYTTLDCTVINADIASGKILVNPIIINTEQITILSGGEIDLAAETVSLDFNTKVRKGIGISAGMVVNPFIRLGGDLSSPTIELDPTAVAVSGSVAVATAGLSLLGRSLWDRFLTSRDPCGQALKKLAEAEADAERK
jgi:uncharacterized protein involved in outer membrane biogenesis